MRIWKVPLEFCYWSLLVSLLGVTKRLLYAAGALLVNQWWYKGSIVRPVFFSFLALLLPGKVG